MFKKVFLSNLSQTKPIEISNEWDVKKFSNLAEINPEVIGKNYPHKKILYVDIGSIENFQITNYDSFELESRPSRAQRIIKKNDVIVSTVRPYLKGFAKLQDEKTNIICSTGFTVIRAKNKEDGELIFQHVKGKSFETNIIRQMDGLAYPAVNSSVIDNSLIPYPSDKQERGKIVSILSNVDSLISQYDKVLEHTKKLKTGLMQKLLTKGIGHTKFKKVKGYFGKEIEIPEDWEIKKIVDITLKIMKGIFDMSPENYVPKGIPFLRISDIQNNILNFSNSVYIRNSTSKEFPSSELYHNDIVLAKVGSIYSNDKIASIPKDVSKCNISQNIIGIKPDQSKINSDFLLFELMKNHHIVASFSNVTVQGSLRLEVIRNLKIPVPTLKEQHKIVVTLLNVDSKINDLKSKKSSLEILKKGLMQKLLTGQIRV